MTRDKEDGGAARATALILTANACMLVFGAILLLMGSLLPSLAASYVEAGSLGSLPLVGILAATVLVGPALDTVGAKPVLAAGLALVAGSLAIMPACRTYGELAAAALGYGLGGGVLNTATNALVADLRADGRGAALNLLGFSFSLGAFLAPFVMAQLAGRDAGHGRALQEGGALPLLALGAAAILIPVLSLRFPEPARKGSRLGGLLGVLNNRLLWLFGLLLFFESGSENCMFVWTGKIVAGGFGLAPASAALALAGLTAAMGVGRLSASQYLRYLGSRKTLVLSAAAVAAGAGIAYGARSFALALAGLMIVGLGMSSIFPTALGVAGDRFPRETGTVFGAIMTLALVGGAAAPTVAGWVATRGLVDVLWVPITSAAAVAVLSVVVTGEPEAAARRE